MPNLSNVAIQQFYDAFINEYSAKAVLGSGKTTQLVSGVRGDAYKWPVQGNILMQERGAYGSLVPLVDVDYTRKTTTFTDYATGVTVDEHEQALLETDVVGTLPAKLAASAARMEDQIIIDTLVGTTVPSSNDIAHGGTNLTVAKVMEVAEAFKEQNVPEEDRFLLITANQRTALLNDDKVLNTLYVNNRNLMTGQLDQLLGMNIITLGNYIEGGLPVTSNIRSCFAWQRNALGLVRSINAKTNVEWLPQNLSYLASVNMRLGASTLLEEGVSIIYCDETA